MHFLSPAKWPLPPNLDYEDLKDSIRDDPDLVLCFETMFLLSMSLKNAAELAPGYMRYLGAKLKAEASLLTYWSSAASFELLVAVKNHDVEAAAEAIQQGASVRAKFIDSKMSALEFACAMKSAHVATSMRAAWESCRPSQNEITKACIKCIERVEHEKVMDARNTQRYVARVMARGCAKDPAVLVDKYVKRAVCNSLKHVRVREQRMKELERENRKKESAITGEILIDEAELGRFFKSLIF